MRGLTKKPSPARCARLPPPAGLRNRESAGEGLPRERGVVFAGGRPPLSIALDCISFVDSDHHFQSIGLHLMRKLIPLFFLLLVFTGCVVALGNRDSVRPATTPTLGQQLLDLQKARETGAISEAEFQQEKSRLLEKK